MKRFLLALISLLLLFSLSAVAEEETEEVPVEPTAPQYAPATPTDLCAHEHTHTEYSFDSPVYRPLNAESHTVTGRAVILEVCDDCGLTLSSAVESNAEQVCPHVFRKGQCVLCGREGGKRQITEKAPTEEILTLTTDEENPTQYFCTLTGRDLEDAADTLVLRPEGGETAIALQTEPLRQEIDRTGGTLTAEIEDPGTGDVSASVRLYSAEGEESAPETREISLRVYAENGGDVLMVSYTDPEGETSSEEASWVTPEDKDAEPYWSVTWLGDGLYSY